MFNRIPFIKNLNRKNNAAPENPARPKTAHKSLFFSVSSAYTVKAVDEIAATTFINTEA